MLGFKHLTFAFTGLGWIYRTQEDSFAFDLWRNRFRGRGDGIEGIETEVSAERRYVSSGKARCLWPCGAWSSPLSLWNMTYKSFTDKHEGEPRAEGVNEPRGGVRADEPWRRVLVGEPRGEEVRHEPCGMRGDLEGETEAFRVGVRR